VIHEFDYKRIIYLTFAIKGGQKSKKALYKISDYPDIAPNLQSGPKKHPMAHVRVSISRGADMSIGGILMPMSRFVII